jgi:predicted dehydrogenase
MNQSIHAIDLLQWIAGDVDVVSAQGGRVIHAGIETEDTLSCSLRFKSGAFGTIVGTTAMFPGAPPRLEIGGENGAAISEGGLKVFKFRDESPDDQLLLEKLRTIQTKSAPGPICKDSPLDLHGKNILHILQSWEAGQDAQTSGPEARKAVAIVAAIYQSNRQGGTPIKLTYPS